MYSAGAVCSNRPMSGHDRRSAIERHESRHAFPSQQMIPNMSYHRTAFLAIFLCTFCSVAIAQRGGSPAIDLRKGINDSFLDPQLDPQQFVERFERDGREAYEARNAILEATGIQSGMRVADVGAGTGLFTVLFSSHVGPDGWVYAIDISPKFIEHIANRAQEAGIENVTPVLCDQDSVNLPPNSIDVAFVCDTYHHFEFPIATVGSIYKTLRPGGKLVVIDFQRDEETSSEWILGHVRAGQDVFTSEIQSVGFEGPQTPEVEGLEENYLLVFRKPEKHKNYAQALPAWQSLFALLNEVLLICPSDKPPDIGVLCAPRAGLWIKFLRSGPQKG